MDEEQIVNLALEAIELAKNSGKIKKGCNEVTKAMEKGTAKMVAFAGDVSPVEITMHLPVLGKEKGIPTIKVPSKTDLGASAGLNVSTVAVAILKEGDAKDKVKEIVDVLGEAN